MRVSIEIDAPLETVWEEIADLASHSDWMRDARRIRFASERREGVGTRMEVETRVGPLRSWDLIEVVGWEPPRRIAVVHRGAVEGAGEFLLEPLDDGGTRFTWTEELRFPWYLGGRAGAALAKPVLGSVWRGNLRRFRRRVEG